MRTIITIQINRYIALSVLLLISVINYAKTPVVPLVRYISTNDGLSSPYIRQIVEDDLGNIWFGGSGTGTGCDVYDGNSFKNWTFLKNLDASSGNIIVAEKLSNGKVWLGYGTYGKQSPISILDPLMKNMTYYDSLPMPNGETMDLHKLKLSIFKFDKTERVVWLLGRKAGMYKLDLNSNHEPVSIKHISLPFKFGKKFAYGSMCVDNENNVWVAYGERIFMAKAGTEVFDIVENPKGVQVRNIIKDRSNRILFGTSSGLYKADGLNIKPIFTDTNFPLSKSNITAIYQDELGQYWFGAREGLCRMSSLSEQSSYVVVAPELAGKVFYTIVGDSYGGIWFSLKLAGVGYVNLYDTPFGYLPGHEFKQKDTTVGIYFKDDNGADWMLTDKGLSIYDPKKGKYYYYNRTGKPTEKTFPQPPAIGIFKSKSGEIWIYFVNVFLCKVKGSDYANLKFEWSYLDMKRMRNLSNMIEDDQGYLWVSSSVSGVARFNPKTEEMVSFKYGKVLSLLNDKDENAIWLSTTNQGVKKVYLDKDSNPVKVKTFPVNEDKNPNIRSYPVRHLQYDSHGTIWVGNQDGVIYYLEDTKEGDFEPLSKGATIPDEHIRLLLVDKDGIWVAGNNLYFYNRKHNTLKTFSKHVTKDNLFSKNGKWRDKDGNVYFTGTHGVNFTNADYIKKSPYNPTIYLSQLFIHGKEVGVGEEFNGRVLLNKPLVKKNTFTFFHNEKDLRFVVRGIYPPAAVSLDYYYFLEGLQKEWSHSSDGTINFGVLPAGEYELRVYVKDKVGHQSKELKVSIIILPPWWETVWFRIVAVILTFLIPYLIYRRKLSVLKNNKLKLEAIVRDRTQEISVRNEELRQQAEEISSQRDHISSQHIALQESYRDIYKLSDFGKELSVIRDTNVLTDITLQSLLSFMDVDTFAIGVVKNKGKALHLFTRVNGQQEEVRLNVDKDINRLSVKCLNEQQTIQVDNEADLLDLGENIKGLKGLKSAIYTPLLYQNKSLGVLVVQAKSENAYTDRHITILQTLTAYLASTIENINSYDIIVEKNDNIIASIQYAKTIQKALLSSVNSVISYFPEHFVFYKPKDIVSGDFYWAYQRDNKLFLAVVDCTGHGVPGALLSVIGVNILNKVVGELGIEDASQILEEINNEIKGLLSQETSRNDDGMDMSICVFEKIENATMNVAFAGAKANLQIVRNGADSCEIVKGTRRSIGGWSSSAKRNFELHNVTLHKGDCIYLNSDGYIDQSNHEGRKFGSKRFIQLLEANASLGLDQQKDSLYNTVTQYMEGTTQRDDMTVLGVRV